MFMKSPSRNEPITRKEVKSVLAGSSVTPTPMPAATAGAGNGIATPVPATAAPVTEPAKADDALIDARLIVGPNVKLRGAEILDCDTLVVEGRVEATMDSRVLRIAEKGSFSGKVSIDVAEIHGRFEGELTARSQLIIHATGRVSGKVRYGKLVIDEGGELCGEINMLSADNPGTSQSATRSRDDQPPMLSAVAG